MLENMQAMLAESQVPSEVVESGTMCSIILCIDAFFFYRMELRRLQFEGEDQYGEKEFTVLSPSPLSPLDPSTTTAEMIQVPISFLQGGEREMGFAERVDT